MMHFAAEKLARLKIGYLLLLTKFTPDSIRFAV